MRGLLSAVQITLSLILPVRPSCDSIGPCLGVFFIGLCLGFFVLGCVVLFPVMVGVHVHLKNIFFLTVRPSSGHPWVCITDPPQVG